MKTLFTYLAIPILLFCCAEEKPRSIVVSVLSDKTDSIIPLPKFQQIRHFFDDGLYDKGNRVFCFGTITNTLLNASYRSELKSSSILDNTLQRKSETEQFYKAIDELLQQQGSDRKMYRNSSILIPLVAHLEELKQSTEDDKIVLLYSDILEASDLFNVYKDSYTLLHNPKKVIDHLKSQVSVPELKGISLYIIYYPMDMEDDRLFNAMVRVYRKLFKDSGLDINIGLTNAVPSK